jgi:hypothetical protein
VILNILNVESWPGLFPDELGEVHDYLAEEKVDFCKKDGYYIQASWFHLGLPPFLKLQASPFRQKIRFTSSAVSRVEIFRSCFYGNFVYL